MIILDTSLVAELVRGPRADPAVLAWVRRLDSQPVTTVINRAELLAGIALLPAGSRRTALATAIEDTLADLTICLPFTADCPAVYAQLVAARTRVGAPIATRVALVAAIATVNGATIASREPAAYDGLGLGVVDPGEPVAQPASTTGTP